MTDSTTPTGTQANTAVTGTHGGTVNLNTAKRESLKASGFNDAQIEALLSLADPDDQGNSLTPMHFSLVDKSTLNSLQFTGKLSEASRQFVYAQTPVSLLNQVSNPSNWQGDSYIGPGASVVNSYLQGEPVDFSKQSLDALIMSVMTSRAEILQEQLREQIDSIQEKNKRLEVANTWLTRAKDAKTDAGTSGSTSFNRSFTSIDGPDGKTFKEYWDSIGAEHQSGSNHNSADWDVNIQGLKKEIEKLTSQSQLETTKLQQTINKYNQSFEMLSNFINKYYQSLSTIIQNLR